MRILDNIEHLFYKFRWYRTTVVGAIVALVVVHVMGCM